jgi:calmodulin
MAALVEATLAAETVSVDMSTLATEDIDRFRTIFDAVGLYFFLVTSSTQNALLSSTDVDHSGTITNDELQGLFKILEMEVTDEEIDRLVRIVDVDRSGTLSFHEFVTMVCVMAANEEKEKEEHRSNLRVVFDSVGESSASPFSLNPPPTTDSDKSGSISTEELGEMFKTLGYETTVEEITQLITLVDADGNGALDFEEFVTLMDLFLQPSSSATD